jgi:hypothetical protein
MPRKKSIEELPPTCAACADRPADGSLYLNFAPYDHKPREYKYGESLPIDRGWSLHLPMCAPCVKKTVGLKLDVQLDLKDAGRVWGHVDSIKRST